MSEGAGERELAFDESDKEGRALLEAYLQKYNREFKPIGLDYKPENTKYEVDKCDNKIVICKDVEIQFYVISPERPTESDQRDIMKRIAQKVEANAELLAEIESRSRNMAADQVKRYDVKLIVKEFHHCSELECPLLDDSSCYYFDFTPDMPLCAVALLARRMRQNIPVCVRSMDVDCCVALHLFVELCREAGYRNIAWFAPNDLVKKRLSSNVGDTFDGSVVVVTQSGDIDSAVECFRDATRDYRYGWRVRRLLVQESALGRVRRALGRNRDVTARDFLEDSSSSLDDVSLEAYRTSRELMSLLRRHRPRYLSLWCSDTSVCYEVSLAAAAHVWVNDHACLHGPHLKSHSAAMIDDLQLLVTKARYFTRSDRGEDGNVTYEQLASLRSAWLKNSVVARRGVVLEILRGCGDLSLNLNRSIEDLVGWEPNTFVSVDNGTLYQGFERPRGVVVFRVATKECFERYLSLILRSVVAGNGVLFDDAISMNEDRNLHDFCERMSKRGVPVLIERNCNIPQLLHLGVDQVIDTNEPLNDIARSLFKTKVISCHYGETFAN